MSVGASVSTPVRRVLDTNIVLDLWVFDEPQAEALRTSVESGSTQWLATAAMREELARVLTGHRKVLDRSGNPVLDSEGQPITEPILGDEMRTKVLLELQQYVHPKLKAVEMTVKKAELTDEQVEARLQQLLAKAAAKD